MSLAQATDPGARIHSPHHAPVRFQLLAPHRRAHVVRAVAAAALLLGYVDLVRGGIVVAPILLVAGYLLLVPLALLTR
jgi:hypothetical protein